MKIVYNHFDGVITEDFLQKVADFEGFRSTAYLCPSGVWTIGFGHTYGVSKDLKISLDIASELLYSDLRSVYLELNTKIHFLDFSSLPLGLQQALVDFTFNCGFGRFLSSGAYRILSKWSISTDKERLSLLNQISANLQLYIYSKGKRLNGLKRRRQWEASLIDACSLQR